MKMLNVHILTKHQNNCREFVTPCLKDEPEERPSTEVLVDHKFILEHNSSWNCDMAMNELRLS